MTEKLARESEGIDVDVPRWNQNTYWGRAKYFFTTTNPLNILKTDEELKSAKDIIDRYKAGKIKEIKENDLYKAKDIVDSAFHPETGEKMILIGRMSAQVPMNMLITGCMITFYRSTPAVIFWQWCNQSFNAIVNYTNRSGDASIPKEQIVTSYVLATAGALSTALYLNKLVGKCRSTLLARLVPFAAVATANCINIPLMRMKELKDGIPVYDEKGNNLGYSKRASVAGISAVVFSRVLMASPGMVFTPLIMEKLQKGRVLNRYPFLAAPIQVFWVGFFLTFATPMCCALFPQMSSISVKNLEEPIQLEAQKYHPTPSRAYYNKGL